MSYLFFVLPYPHIDPVFLHLGPVQLRWYGLMYAVGLGPVARVGQADLVLPDLSHVTLPDILQRLAATTPGG